MIDLDSLKPGCWLVVVSHEKNADLMRESREDLSGMRGQVFPSRANAHLWAFGARLHGWNVLGIIPTDELLK